MITHRIIRARDLEPSLDTIIVTLPGRTIRSQAVMVQAHDHGYVQVAFASGDILSLSARAMVGRIDHRPASPRRRTSRQKGAQ